LPDEKPSCTQLNRCSLCGAGPPASYCDERGEQGCERGCEEQAYSERVARAPSARPPAEHDGNAGETREADGHLGNQGKGFDENLRNAG
jgi:hypothetical protein